MGAIAIQEDSKLIPAGDAPMVAMIERIVLDPNIPIDRLEKMLAMKERMEDRAREDQERQERKAYFAAMSACQAELPVVVKKSRNSHTNSNYADLAAIEDQAMPIIHRHGFAVSFQPDGYNDRGELRILWEISHSEGHVRNGVGEIPVDGAGAQGKVNKTGTQAFGSTATYGRRYLLCMLFNISTGDDNDGNRVKEPVAPETISKEQVKTILSLLEETDSDVEQFCRLGKIEAVPDMLARQFDSAVRMLNERKAKMAQRAAQ
ncbi:MULTISPECIES: ERF family protein [unclassified Sinorhizobium]|uniref:ERF family protein n=1 Tax=unclassified Sinorhizobium TaxID=2613772 RepID=UPI0035259C86